MPDRVDSAPERITPATTPHRATTAGSSTAASRADAPAKADSVRCERCGTEMFRMHAVWRCPSCGYKTDCCGW
jgi:rubrerythrin